MVSPVFKLWFEYQIFYHLNTRLLKVLNLNGSEIRMSSIWVPTVCVKLIYFWCILALESQCKVVVKGVLVLRMRPSHYRINFKMMNNGHCMVMNNPLSPLFRYPSCCFLLPWTKIDPWFIFQMAPWLSLTLSSNTEHPSRRYQSFGNVGFQDDRIRRN